MDQINETKPPMTYRKKGLRIGKIVLLILMIAFAIFVVGTYSSSNCSGLDWGLGPTYCTFPTHVFQMLFFSAVFFWWWAIPLVLLIPMAIGWIMDKKKK